MKVHFLALEGLNIFEQLQMEEALLRLDDRNICLINFGTPPAIVMGISGKADELIDQSAQEQLKLPLIKRFSGGGTVVVDHNTIFTTFIMNSKDCNVAGCPDQMFNWAKDIFASIFSPHPFDLKERDFIFGEKKFGGNAQYICKDRWLHHTSFLWDYCPDHMASLKLPQKRPLYRGDRSHNDFLCKLKDYYPSQDHFKSTLMNGLQAQFELQPLNLEEVQKLLEQPYRKTTQRLI